LCLCILFFLPLQANAAKNQVAQKSARLSEKLVSLRGNVLSLQQSLIDGLKEQKAAKENLKKIKKLLALQHEERELGRKRIQELETTIGELESRRGVIRERIASQKKIIRLSLIELHRSLSEDPKTLRLPENEVIEAPRRKVLSNMVDRSLREIETLKADSEDVDHLQARIQEEEQQLTYLFQDLKEQESVLELNRQLQVDILKKKHAERLSQLDNYRALKSAEAQVEKLISDFNARIELEQNVENERVISKAMMQGAFARLKGSLPLPVPGKIASQFGRSFDSQSNLQVFKKGIEIAASKKSEVRAISAGKIAYAGVLPNYGTIAIVDHGDHFYSLCGHLGTVSRQVGDCVKAGDVIGMSDDAGTPVYFEIRARNIPVNPLQWVSN
jgi:septal ring factor EnvC (AmiA/AmiB activator)